MHPMPVANGGAPPANRLVARRPRARQPLPAVAGRRRNAGVTGATLRRNHDASRWRCIANQEDLVQTTIATVALEGTYDVELSLKRHLGYMEEAAAQGADLVVFPEISIQGYPPDLDRFYAGRI